MDQALIASLTLTKFARCAMKSIIDPIIQIKFAWYVRMKTSKIGIQEKQD